MAQPLTMGQPIEPLTMGQPITVQAMPVAQATPMQTAPMPMQMVAAPMPVISFPCDADKQDKLQSIKAGGVPPGLASRGLTPAQWAECEAVSTVSDAQFFKNCPGMECCYYCIPGGPIQCCLCLLNPFTLFVILPPVNKAKRDCTERCNAILRPYGYQASAPDGLEDVIRFEPITGAM
jgi:hypothetical protein